MKKAEISRNNIRGSGAVLLTRGIMVLLIYCAIQNLLRLFLSFFYFIQTNNILEEVYLCHNQFALEGCKAISDLIKYNKVLKLLSLKGNMFTSECATMLAEALARNSTLKSLFVNILLFQLFHHTISSSGSNNFLLNFFQLDDNNFTNTGVYEILDSLNSDTSNLELLSLKVYTFFFFLN